MQYLMLEFDYSPVDDPFGEVIASMAERDMWDLLSAASGVVETILRQIGVDYIHDYAWIDGKIYKLIRTDDPSSVIGLISDALADHRTHQDASASAVVVDLVRTEEKDPTIVSPWRLLSIKERMDLSPQQAVELANRRRAERETMWSD